MNLSSIWTRDRAIGVGLSLLVILASSYIMLGWPPIRDGLVSLGSELISANGLAALGTFVAAAVALQIATSQRDEAKENAKVRAQLIAWEVEPALRTIEASASRLSAVYVWLRKRGHRSR